MRTFTRNVIKILINEAHEVIILRFIRMMGGTGYQS